MDWRHVAGTAFVVMPFLVLTLTMAQSIGWRPTLLIWGSIASAVIGVCLLAG